MPTSINNGGTWETIEEIYINNSGTWERIDEIYVNNAGTWELVFQGDLINITDVLASSAVSGVGNATAVYELHSDGSINATSGDNTVIDIGSWITPQTNMSGYSVFATLVSGTITGTMGSWLNLGTTRTWSRTNASAGTTTASMIIDIRRDSDSVIMDSATITFEASSVA